jgi:mannose-1-phosphate guanylyltransferase
VKPNVYVVIMAGGGGTRMWPASRKKQPKQFLPILPGGRTLLGATVDRLLPLFPAERILVVTAKSQVGEVERCAPAIARENIVVEPLGRNTAACIGLAALEVKRRDARGLMAVVPSDQFVADDVAYLATISRACAVADAGSICTIGIPPRHPETGFGYLERGEVRPDGAFALRRFVEKPNAETARSYVASGRFLWNSGMFFFPAQRILDEISRHLPELGRTLAAIWEQPAELDRLYATAQSISIDYGVMEKLAPEQIAVEPGEFGWNDVGSWSALADIAAGDESGNVARAEVALVDAHNNILYGNKLIAAVGVSDLVIVATDDAVLVLPKSRAQDVKSIVEQLTARKHASL